MREHDLRVDCDQLSMGFLKGSFFSIVEDFDNKPGIEVLLRVFNGFVDEYEGPGRYYHTLLHPQRLLILQSKLKEIIHDPANMTRLIWGHDVIHVPGRNDNEKMSAEYATDKFGILGVPDRDLEKTSAHILTTADHINPFDDPDLDLFLDMDMSILASLRQRYIQYSREIEAEFKNVVPLSVYRSERGRLGFLRGVLDRPIFRTPIFKPLEHHARENIEWEIDQLQAA